MQKNKIIFFLYMTKEILRINGLEMILLLLISNNIYRKEFKLSFISGLIGCKKNDSKIFKFIQKTIFILFNFKSVYNVRANKTLKILLLINNFFILQSAKDSLHINDSFYKPYHRTALVSEIILANTVLYKKKSKIKLLWFFMSLIYILIFVNKKNGKFPIPKNILILYQYLLILMFENDAN